MLGYDNVCKNQCLYCGMRAGNREIQRYRIPPAEVLQLADNAREMSLTRLFLVAGEDPGYGFDNLLSLVRGAAERGLRVSLAAGEFSREEYRLLKEAGVEEYVLKFEMSDRETFNRLNPSTTFERRMACIEAIRDCGMLLGIGEYRRLPGTDAGTACRRHPSDEKAGNPLGADHSLYARRWYAAGRRGGAGKPGLEPAGDRHPALHDAGDRHHGAAARAKTRPRGWRGRRGTWPRCRPGPTCCSSICCLPPWPRISGSSITG